MKELSLARIVAEVLSRAGIGRVYGIIGTSVLDLVDALYDYKDRIDFVTTRHEQVAASAADAEARVTGRPGVAVVHAGPGFLNTAISLGIALRDRVPLLLVSGGVRRRLRGTGAWLEVDQESVARGVAKSYHLVKSAGDAPEILADAIRESLEPPRGPVVVEVVEDAWNEKARVPDEFPENLDLAVEPGPGDAIALARDALSLLEDAERPVILACGELAFDPRFRQEDLLELAERIGAYIVTSGNGRGACPEDHPRCLGRAGFGGGSLTADTAFEKSDLVIVLGNEFDDITTYAYTMLPEGDILVASLDPLVWKRPAYYEAYKADPIAALKALLDEARRRGPAPKRGLDPIVGEAGRKWRAILDEALRREYKDLPNPARFFRALDESLPRNRILSAGQGTHILYTYSYMHIYRPRSFLAATNLGAMGYAYPAALGASLARRDTPVVSVVGDGDFLMTVQDLETAVREGAPVKVVVVNDNSYKVLYLRQVIQKGGRVYETLLGNPDFVELAKSFGVRAMRVESDSDTPKAIDMILGSEGPVLVELPVRPDDLPPLNLEYTLRMS
ncbi:MAG: thiamine pyrophosphate-binding protein [Desulfurococcales archaeon]|nr:thiamine pyrophosphate-binding protein [Desulfurococcales archaeon]